MKNLQIGVNEEGQLTINNFTESCFVYYLKNTLIPDLIESGMEATAADFEVALGFISERRRLEEKAS